MSDRIEAPWTPQEVIALNRWQAAGTVHPFTCPNNHPRRTLLARVDGWHCTVCGYRQNWAHRLMLREPTDPSSLGDNLSTKGGITALDAT